MNKQQLAANIWSSANKMRSKIEANEYKDYILGLIFYKFLSDEQVSFFKSDGYSDEDIQTINESVQGTVNYCKDNIGYFISYENLFSTWLSMGRDFGVDNVRTAISAFNRNISDKHLHVFDKIFDTLNSGLSKLGDSTGTQTKALNELIHLIKDIPTDGNHGYDVLGFVYEYLISNFAANAGKKAGEFYTPHEVSVLMSEIIAYHLRDREKIKIYDPTSGSGSLLINIGKSVAGYTSNDKEIKYYAQELKQNTYNLTRMNLVMRGIPAAYIYTRNADTLEEDWPYENESDKDGAYEPLHVDAVVSNPPYSQNWDTTDKESDPRFDGFGLAPSSKADYAFLLHDLYHIRHDGIMTIVLPHGVLFRGNDEETIRRNLIEKNHIDVVIGLPPNIFFGTGIPTIIMVLKKNKPSRDILFIDASKGFVKEGNSNKLRACDIKKIADTVAERKDIEKYSRRVDIEEIRNNDYNLNIPRYIDSSDEPEEYDIYATFFGGVPNNEINKLDKYWKVFPSLRDDLFNDENPHCSTVKTDDIYSVIHQNNDVKVWSESLIKAFDNFNSVLENNLIFNLANVNAAEEENKISKDIFNRISGIALIDKYIAYQLFSEQWEIISIDLEIIGTEGVGSVRKVDPNMVFKKSKNVEVEVQDGWRGRIIPFELVQQTILKEDYEKLQNKENQVESIDAELSEIIENMTDEERAGDYLNDANDAFVKKELNNKINTILDSIKTEETKLLSQYLKLRRKSDKLEFIKDNNTVCWSKMNQNADGTYKVSEVNNYIKRIKSNYIFPPDSLEEKIIRAGKLLDTQKTLSQEINKEKVRLHKLTKETIETLTQEQVDSLLKLKWIQPLYDVLIEMPKTVIDGFINEIQSLEDKYKDSYIDITNEIEEISESVSLLIDELEGDESDMIGLKEFQKLLKEDDYVQA